MTNPASGEFTSIPKLQQDSQQLQQYAAESHEELTAYANRIADEAAVFAAKAEEINATAAAWDNMAGQLRAAGHDPQTCSDAAHTAETLRVLAQASQESAERAAALAEQVRVAATAAEHVANAAGNGAVNIQNNLQGLMEHARNDSNAPVNHFAHQ